MKNVHFQTTGRQVKVVVKTSACVVALGFALCSACSPFSRFEGRPDDNNTLPPPKVDVTPEFPLTNDDLICTATEADIQSITYYYAWFKNDVLQPNLTTKVVNASYTSKGDVWKCVVIGSDGTDSSSPVSDEVTIFNTAPTAPAAHITPDSPTSDDNLVCSMTHLGSDTDGDTIVYAYQWYENGLLQPNLLTDTVDAGYTSAGSIWNCVVIAYDGTASAASTSDQVTLASSSGNPAPDPSPSDPSPSDPDPSNNAPSAPVVAITPSTPATTNNLVCSITTPSTDADGDTITYSYKWYKNNVLQSGLTTNTVAASYTTKGQVWKCVVTASDGTASTSGTSNQVTIVNSTPTAPVIHVTPEQPVGSDNLTCSITTASTDADGDTITYTYQWYKNNILQAGLTTNSVAASYTAPVETWKCIVTATDGQSNRSGSSNQVTITESEQIRAMYVWGMFYKILTESSEQDRFLVICQAENINTVYMQMDGDTINFFNNASGYTPNAYQTLITRTNALGIEIHGVIGGVADDINHPERHQQYIVGIIKYNIQNPSCRITGINWDLEYASDRTAYTNYMRTLKSYSYQGQTIVSQGLTLSIYDGGWDTSQGRTLWNEFDVICIDGYQDALDDGPDGGVIGKVMGGPAACEAIGKRFVIGLETDELNRGSSSYDYTRQSLWEEGQDACHELMSEIDAYFGSRYTQYSGIFLHHYQEGISEWYCIEDVQWPSGTFHAGDTVTVPVTLRTSAHHGSKARGVELMLRDKNGNIWRVNCIVVLPDIGTRVVNMRWVIPVGAPRGQYDAKVAVYDLDVYASWSRDPLVNVYGDFAGNSDYGNPPSDIEELTLDQYIQLCDDYPDIFYGYYRQNPRDVVIDYVGWEDDVFTVA